MDVICGVSGRSLRSRAVVLNRTREPPFSDRAAPAVRERLAAILPEASAVPTWRALEEEAQLAREDASALGALAGELDGIPVIALPELPVDAHDLASLAQLHRHFLESGARS